MENFVKDLQIGEINLRDRLQFELKSDFFPQKKLKTNTYKQEFFIFIPNSLQINNDSYPSARFYQDLTNLVRYKTPYFSLKQLIDPTNGKSPLNRIKWDGKNSNEEELKLLGNIVRSSLRVSANQIMHGEKDIASYCSEIREFRKNFSCHEKNIKEKFPESHCLFVDEFISNSILFYSIGLLEIKKDEELLKLIKEEQDYRNENFIIDTKEEKSMSDSEYILYRTGLLNKFVLDALRLNFKRSMVFHQYRNLIGAISAGIAMMMFFTLFVWQGEVFIINSMPFIIITVLLYILKDRMKESIRNFSYEHFHRLYPDYKTDILSPNGKKVIGVMKESFSFIKESEVPKEVLDIRNQEFHVILEKLKRHEQILYYKKLISIYKPPTHGDDRRNSLSIIFRFNIHHFIEKADNPLHRYVGVDTATGKFIQKKLPKVYHLNIILKNTFMNDRLEEVVEYKKYRLILDKNGIKRKDVIIYPSQ